MLAWKHSPKTALPFNNFAVLVTTGNLTATVENRNDILTQLNLLNQPDLW